nr:hypothetical protein [Tanacetum cinerariifolium]
REEKQIEEEQTAKAQNWKLSVCYDDDDDEERSNSLQDNIISELPLCSAITLNEPADSLSTRDEHLNTIPTTESDEFIKSCVENLVPNPSESKGENGCDVPACFTTFSNVLFDAEYEFDSSDDQSLSDEDFPEKIFSNPLFEEEIIPMKIDQHHFNAESDLIESMLNHDSSIIHSFSKIDSLLDEFAAELTLLKSIPPGIDKTDCDHENEIRLIERFLYDNSSPRPPKEFVSENSNADIESFFPSPIPNEDSDSYMEEIDLFLTPDDPMPPGIKDDDDDSGRDILIREELLDNYSLSLPVIESFYFDIPLFFCPPAKPPDGWSNSITFRFSVGLQTPDDLSRSRLGFIEKMDETDTQEKDKNKAENDKTKHEMEKIKKDKVIRSQKSKVKARGQQKSTPRKSKSQSPEMSNLHELSPPIVMMVDQRTMAQLLQAPTEGYEDAIVVPAITADNFELKHGLLTLFPNVPNTSIKLTLFPFSLKGAARIWLEKEPPRSIFTWDDLVSKFINQFFPPFKTTNLRNEITNFQQRFDESFCEAWYRFKDLLRACPHHGFLELHQLDTCYNALNSKDQDSLNSAAGGNFLDKMPHECLAIIESKSKVGYSRNKPVVAKVSMNTSTSDISPDVAELKHMVKELLLDKKSQNQAPATVKAVEESCVTCGGVHSYHNCPATNGNVYRDNIQEFISQASAVNYNQGNTSYRPPMMNNQNRFNENQNRGNNFNHGPVYQPTVFQPPAYQPPAYQAPAPQTQSVSNEDFSAYVKANDAVMRNMQTQGQNMQNQLTNLTELLTKFVNSNNSFTSSSATLTSNTIANPRSDLKAITTRSGVSYDGPQILSSPAFLPKVVENEPEATKDTVHPTNNGSTQDVQPQVVQYKSPILNSEPVNSPIIEPVISLVSAPRPNQRPSIPYPSRMQDQKLRDKANDQREKFFQIFKDLNFNISFVDALILMPKFGPSIKSLLTNKDKLCRMLSPGRSRRKHQSNADKLFLPDLSPTCMTLELTNRSISRPVGVAEDVYVKVGTFYFSADFVVVDFDADPRVPLILGRSFLKTGRSLIDVFEGELTLRVGKEAITFNLDQTSRYSANYSDMMANQIDVIDMASKYDKSSIDEPLEVELKDLPSHLGYAFLESNDKLPVIIAKYLSVEENTALITVLKSHKRAIAWKLSDIKGIDPEFCTHKILMEEDFEPADQHQRKVNPKIYDVIKQEVLKLLDAGLIYPISDSPWVSLVHYVPKNGGFTVVENEDNELISARLVTGWRVCIDYRKLNETTRKDNFPLPFIDQMLERLAGNQYYCFLDGFSGYFQIPIDPKDQEKTTFTCPYGTFAYRRMPFGLCNAPSMFQSCLSHLEKTLKRCEDTNLFLNWEKSHFMVKEGIVLGHKISKQGIEVDKAKVDVITKLPHPTTVKGIRSFLGRADFYRRKPLKFSRLATMDPPRDTIAQITQPRSDRGTHFCNDQFAKVMQKFDVTHRLATSYHPQTSGQVEVSNHGLKRILERTLRENRASWSDKLDDVLWTTGDHEKVQLNELNELRDQAYENSLIYKEKTKRLHDSKIKDRVFNIGDRVLLFNSRLKIFSGKLKSCWTGPFTISHVYPYGTVELAQLDGPNFKVNGHRFKHYFGKDVPKMVVLDLQTFPKDH